MFLARIIDGRVSVYPVDSVETYFVGIHHVSSLFHMRPRQPRGWRVESHTGTGSAAIDHTAKAAIARAMKAAKGAP